MAMGELATMIFIEATVGPAVTAAVSSILSRNKQRRKCSSYYTMLLHGPPALQDEIMKIGSEEGCWTESFMDTFRKANGYISVEQRGVKSTLAKTLTDPTIAAKLATGKVDRAVVHAVKNANRTILKETISSTPQNTKTSAKTTNILKNTQEHDVTTQKIDQKVAKENNQSKESENSESPPSLKYS